MLESVTDILRPDPALIAIWRTTVLLFAFFLIGLSAAIFFKRGLAMTFLSKFASTPLINATEAVLRLLVGVSFMGAAPDLRYSQVAFFFGLLLAVTAVPMLFLPKAHARYGAWSMKILPKILPLYSIVALAMGIFILYANQSVFGF